jgi:hypothetical protein
MKNEMTAAELRKSNGRAPGWFDQAPGGWKMKHGMVKFVRITGALRPSVITILYSPRFDENGKLVLAGTNSTATAEGSYSVLSSTNMAAPLFDWTTNLSGVFGAGGSFSNAIELNPSQAQRFFIIKTP